VGFDLHALLEGVEAEHRGFEDTHRTHVGFFRNFQPREGIGRIDEESAEVFAAHKEAAQVKAHADAAVHTAEAEVTTLKGVLAATKAAHDVLVRGYDEKIARLKEEAAANEARQVREAVDRAKQEDDALLHAKLKTEFAIAHERMV
jgi:hypothetical protein